jgi:hypothetical protein
LVTGPLVGLSFGLLSGLVAWRVAGLLFGLLNGLSVAVVFGLSFGWVSGGGDYLEHYFLRCLLWRSAVMPHLGD